jgi:DNA repair exonuclease SbcCD nuclease subunit
MKIALLNDTHCGIRNSADIFLDNAAKFYSDVFFPYVKEHNIKQIVHLGDYYDNRKAINIKALHHNRKHFLEPMRDFGMRMDIIPGNHDTYFKDTNDPNSLKELLGFFINEIAIIEKPTVLSYDNLNLALVPWINKSNYEETMNFVRTCKADMLGGHLELSGFEMMRGHKNEHGMDPSPFKRFDMVFSGHFHTKSNIENIHYLGTQMEFYWNDCNDKKYFHVLDTDTRELTAVQNPHTLFKKIVYNDEKYVYNSVQDLTNKFVKVIVVNKNNPSMFEKFIDQIQDQDIHELKIAENFDDILTDVDDNKVSLEDTTTLLDSYIDAINTDLSRDRLKTDMRNLYNQAQTLEIV